MVLTISAARQIQSISCNVHLCVVKGSRKKKCLKPEFFRTATVQQSAYVRHLFKMRQNTANVTI